MPYTYSPTWTSTANSITLTNGTQAVPYPQITTTSTTGATTLTWPTYVTGTAGTSGIWDWSDYGCRLAPQLRSPEQEALHAQRLERQERARVARTVATNRAVELLLSLLSPEQRASYERDRSFTVIGSAGGIYRIRPGVMGNVDWIDPANSGREIAGVLCAHPQLWTSDGSLPDPDVALAQMLALTTDEADFVATANVHRGRRPIIRVA